MDDKALHRTNPEIETFLPDDRVHTSCHQADPLPLLARCHVAAMYSPEGKNVLSLVQFSVWSKFSQKSGMEHSCTEASYARPQMSLERELRGQLLR